MGLVGSKIQFLGIWGLALFMTLNTAAILKKEDNSLKIAVSDPISYQEKMEQEKDGIKAPAATTIEYYGGKGFFEATPHHSRDFDAEVEESQKGEESFLDWWDSFEAEDSTSRVNESTGANDEPGDVDDVFDDFLDDTQTDSKVDEDFWW